MIDVRAFLEAAPRWTSEQQGLGLKLHELLARGRPVSRDRLAMEAAASRAQVDEFLDQCSGLHHEDQAGSIIGFGGLALQKMAHRFRVGERTLYTWCAWDSLFMPVILGRRAVVESTCPATGSTVRLEVTPEAVVEVDPAETVVSMLTPQAGDFGRDVLARFCHHVHFFASREAGQDWATGRDDILLLMPDEAHDLGRRFVAGLYADIGSDPRP